MSGANGYPEYSGSGLRRFRNVQGLLDNLALSSRIAATVTKLPAELFRNSSCVTDCRGASGEATMTVVLFAISPVS
jgi:hypothetical protein